MAKKKYGNGNANGQQILELLATIAGTIISLVTLISRLRRESKPTPQLRNKRRRK